MTIAQTLREIIGFLRGWQRRRIPAHLAERSEEALPAQMADMRRKINELIDALGEGRTQRLPEAVQEEAPAGDNFRIEATEGAGESPTPGIAPEVLLLPTTKLWGKATADWTTGATVTVNPCDELGNDVNTGVTVTLYFNTKKAAPDATIQPLIDQGDLLCYLPWGEDGLIVGWMRAGYWK